MRNISTPTESWNSFHADLIALGKGEFEDFYWSRFKFYNKLDLNRMTLKGFFNLHVHASLGGLGFHTSRKLTKDDLTLT